jgi:hypothetical protein
MASTAAAAANDAAFDDYAADGLISGAPDLRAALIAALGRHVSPKELRRLAGSAFPSLARAAFGAMADAARAAPPADPPLVRTAAPRVPPVLHAPGGFWRTQQGSELSGQTNPRRFPQQGVAKRRHRDIVGEPIPAGLVFSNRAQTAPGGLSVDRALGTAPLLWDSRSIASSRASASSANNNNNNNNNNGGGGGGGGGGGSSSSSSLVASRAARSLAAEGGDDGGGGGTENRCPG